jgi:preprotein translocase subunit SecE
MVTTAAGKVNRLKFVGETVSELKKVSWPSRQEATYLTTLVLVFSAVVGLILGGLDFLLSFLVNKLFIGG